MNYLKPHLRHSPLSLATILKASSSTASICAISEPASYRENSLRYHPLAENIHEDPAARITMLFKNLLIGALLILLGTGSTNKHCYGGGWKFEQIEKNGDITAFIEKFCQDMTDRTANVGESVREIQSHVRPETASDEG